jgi:hypothetical protein
VVQEASALTGLVLLLGPQVTQLALALVAVALVIERQSWWPGLLGDGE